MKLVSIAVSITLALAACSNPKAANKANFKEALQAYYDDNPACVASFLDEFPGDVTIDERPIFGGKDYRAAALETALFIKSNERKNKTFSGNQTTITVSLSPLGKQYAKISNGSTQGRLEFCYGKYVVDDIVRFTEPNNMMGMTISEVTYSKRVTDVADWAKSPKALEAWKQISRDQEKQEPQMDALVLTNEGWVHERMLKH